MDLSENDRKVIEALQDGELRAGELADVLGVADRTVRRRAGRLMERGLIERPRQGRYRLTAEGRRKLEEELLAVGLDLGRLTPLIKKLPSPALQAFLCLLLSALIAKTHLFELYGTGWPAFIVGGPTKTGKTLMARIVERLLRFEGLVKHVQTATTGELIGRRDRTAEGWRFEPSPYFRAPFICLDELDKAKGELQRQALYYLTGDRGTLIESCQVEVRPTPLVTLNTDPRKGLSFIPEAYRRRAVVLDTALIKKDLEDLDLVAQGLLKGVPRLDPEKLRPARNRLTDEEIKRLHRLLKENLTDEGWGLSDLQPAVILTLGRSALTGHKDLDEALYQTAWDLLACAETLGHTCAGWRVRVLETWPQRERAGAGAEGLELDHELEAEVVDGDGNGDGSTVRDRAEEVRDARIERAREMGEFVRRRSQAVEGFRLLKDSLFPLGEEVWNRKSKPLRDKLEHYARRARGIEARDWGLLEQWEQLLVECRGEVENFHEGREAALARQRARDETRRRLQAQWAKLERARKKIVELHGRSRTRPGEDVAGRLVELGALSGPFAEQRTKTVHERVYVGRFPLTRPVLKEYSLTYYVGFDGRRYGLNDVSRWGSDPVKDLLAALWNDHYKLQAERVSQNLKALKKGADPSLIEVGEIEPPSPARSQSQPALPGRGRGRGGRRGQGARVQGQKRPERPRQEQEPDPVFPYIPPEVARWLKGKGII